MEPCNRTKRSSGIYLRSNAASVRVAMERLDDLDRRLALEVEEALRIDGDVGLVLTCLRLQLLASACELGMAAAGEPFAASMPRALDLIASYRTAISDACEAVAKARLRVRAA